MKNVDDRDSDALGVSDDDTGVEAGVFVAVAVSLAVCARPETAKQRTRTSPLT